jgi:hypothetical protein
VSERLTSVVEESSRRADIQEQERSYMNYEKTGSKLRGVWEKNCYKLELILVQGHV